MFRFALLATVLFASVATQEDNPSVALARSGAALANLPISAAGEASALKSGFVVDNPKREDLAISRLQDTIRRVVGQLWENIVDQQRFAILKEKGAFEEVVKTFSENLQNDVFALENQIDSSKIEQLLQLIKPDGNGNEAREWSDVVRNLTKITLKIKVLYGYLDGYLTNPNEATQIVLEDYARSILQPGSTQDKALTSSLVDLHQLAVPTSDDDDDNELHDGRRRRTGPLGGPRGIQRTDIFYRLYTILKNQDSAAICDLGQSPQQLVFNLYTLLALAEVKGYAMLQFSYIVLRLSNRGNYTLESDLSNKSFDVQTTEKLTQIKTVLSKMPRYVWTCDPSKQIEGTTYVQLTQLLQGHMENEVDMNSLQSCKESCSNYKVAESQSCFKSLFCSKQPKCNGRMFDCKFYHADSWVCMSNQANRKYDWIEYEDGTILGNKNQCVSNNKIKVDSWWRWLFWHCSYCLCKCDAPGPDSDRYWSLRPVLSDVASNKVITGARFVKKNRVIHIEIEEATALPEGGIDEVSRAWKPAPTMDVSDTEKVKRDVDYFMMTYEQRAVDMDRLEAPVGHVITGIKLRSLGGHINLEIQATPISFTTGKLIPDRSAWIGNDNTPATIDQRQLVNIISPDVPTKFAGRSQIDTGNNQFIVFDATSAEKDVMQTTIPFIDSQNVSPTPGTWISGAGLYHKGAIGYGGYLGIMLKTFDVSRHLVLKKDPSVSYRQSRRSF